MNMDLMGQLEGFEFKKHRAGFQAVALFDNGYGCSIIPESDFVNYEVAILKHENGIHSRMCYDSGLADDVLRWCDVDSVHHIVFKIRNLPEW